MDQTNRIALDGAAIQEMREANETRAAFCRFLASLYLYELTDEQIEAFAHIEIAGDGTAIDEGLRTIKEYLRHRHGGTRQELAVDYARVFLGAGSYDRILAPPYESVFTSEERILMQDARDEVLAIYRSAGLDKKNSWKEGEDHVALELEFEQVLANRTAEALRKSDEEEAAALLTTQRNFLEDHLLSWVPMMTTDMKRFAKTDLYQGLAYLTDGFLNTDKAFLDDVLTEDE